MSRQGRLQATQVLTSAWPGWLAVVRHIDWVVRVGLSRWAVEPITPRGPVSTCCAGPKGQR